MVYEAKGDVEFLEEHVHALIGGDSARVAGIARDYGLRERLATEAEALADGVRKYDQRSTERLHLLLFRYYEQQFSSTPAGRVAVEPAGALLDIVTILEAVMFEQEEREIAPDTFADMPTTGAAFVEWFRNVAHAHVAWNHPFYSDFLANRAGVEDLKYYLTQETTLDPRFDDSLAMMQIGTVGDVKLEIASNYWDEMGGGKPAEVHTTLFAKALVDLGVDDAYKANNISLAAKMSGNLSAAVCLKRRHFYKAIGYFGVTEYMGPHRFKYVVDAWRRNRLPPAGIIYHDLHIGVDAGHALGWMHNVIAPLVDADPAAAAELARGELYRLNSSARYLAATFETRLRDVA